MGTDSAVFTALAPTFFSGRESRKMQPLGGSVFEFERGGELGGELFADGKAEAAATGFGGAARREKARGDFRRKTGAFVLDVALYAGGA